MDWARIGAPIIPDLNWQFFDQPVIGSETFKITNTWSIRPYYKMKAYLGQFWANSEEVSGVRRIYPIKDTKQIITLEIPEEFKDEGLILRYIGVKLARPLPSTASYDWRIELEVFQPMLFS